MVSDRDRERAHALVRRAREGGHTHFAVQFGRMVEDVTDALAEARAQADTDLFDKADEYLSAVGPIPGQELSEDFSRGIEKGVQACRRALEALRVQRRQHPTEDA